MYLSDHFNNNMSNTIMTLRLLVLYIVFFNCPFTVVNGTMKGSLSPAHPCNDYSASNCMVDQENVIGTLYNISPEDCQIACLNDYPTECDFFLHFAVPYGPVCDLINGNFADYVESWQNIGGPPVPAIPDCMATVDPCKVTNIFFLNYIN